MSNIRGITKVLRKSENLFANNKMERASLLSKLPVYIKITKWEYLFLQSYRLQKINKCCSGIIL